LNLELDLVGLKCPGILPIFMQDMYITNDYIGARAAEVAWHADHAC
jgi:hypothetical protein